MNSLLDDVRRAPTPLALTSRGDLAALVKEAHVQALRHALDLGRTPLAQTDVAELRRYALWLEDVALADDQHPFEREQLCSLAATLYEFAGTLTPELGHPSIFFPPLNDDLRGAILASFTPYQAHASLISRRVRDRLTAAAPGAPLADCHRQVALAITALLGRDFASAFAHARKLDALQADAVAEIQAGGGGNSVFLELDRALALGRVCGTLAIGMLVGITSMLDSSIERLDLIRERALRSQDAQHHWLADRLGRVARHMREASMHRLLDRPDVPSVYRHALALDNYVELWEPQREALAHGLLDEPGQHLIASIPTGAGKTLFAELGILAALRGDGDRWAVYVAPSRALVNQVSAELRGRLERCGITVRTVLAGAEPSLNLGDELALLQTHRSVTVTTPEKLDAYYRNAREVFGACRLAIFDEAHKLAEPERGPLIESLVARLLALQPGTRIMLLSGLIGNLAELRDWLGDAGTITVSESRRPTRQVFGVAVRHGPVGYRAPRRRQPADQRVAEFSGGFVIVHEQEDLAEPLQVDLPGVFSSTVTERQAGPAWEADGALPRSTVNDHAIGAAQALARAPGTVLVFVQQVRDAERCCRDFGAAAGDPTPQRQRLARFLRAELGADHPLASHCLGGLAYHHARLPSTVQRAIEYALEQGWLRVVFATPTLREGVNSSATTVLLAGNSAFDEANNRRTPISVADFQNLAGRAGRPRVDTEGRVFLIPDSLAPAQAVTQGQQYILSGEAALRVRSQLAQLAEALGRSAALQDLPLAQQAWLLALEAAEIDGEAALASFLRRSLWAHQEPEATAVAGLARRISRTLEQARATVGGARLRLAARLGLSLSSAERLRRFVEEHRAALAATGAGARGAQLDLLLEISLQLPELRRGALRRQVEPSAHRAPLERWVAGASYHELLEAARGSGALGERAGLSDAVRYAADASLWLSWGFSAAHAVIASTVARPDPWLGQLPLLARYGVPSLAAAYLALLGIADRVAARVLGQAFAADGRATTIRAIAEWLDTVAPRLDALLADEDHGLRTELIKRQVPRDRSVGRPLYRISRCRALAPLAPGTALGCQADDSVVLLTDGQAVVGELLDAADLSTLSGLQQGHLAIFPLVAIRPGEEGPVALVGGGR